MIELFKQEYWSKSFAFMLPLTGLPKTHIYKLESYLFWEDYSIEDYFLIVKFTYEDYGKFLEYCKRKVFPNLDRGGYVVETYDFEDCTIMILDISEWAMDIELFLKGKYSKMSRNAKDTITDFHMYYDKGNKISLDIKSALEPNTLEPLLKMTPLEYAAEAYGLPHEALKKLGEVGGIYNKEKETLTGLKKENDHYLRKEGGALA